MANGPSPLRVLINLGALVRTCIMINHDRDNVFITARLADAYPGFSGATYRALIALARAGVAAVASIDFQDPTDPSEVPQGPRLPS